jgi:hypothetical protein
VVAALLLSRLAGIAVRGAVLAGPDCPDCGPLTTPAVFVSGGAMAISTSTTMATQAKAIVQIMTGLARPERSIGSG